MRLPKRVGLVCWVGLNLVACRAVELPALPEEPAVLDASDPRGQADDAGTPEGDAGAVAGDAGAALADAGPSWPGLDALPEPAGPIVGAVPTGMKSTKAVLGALAEATVHVRPDQRHAAVICEDTTAVTVVLDAVVPTLLGATAKVDVLQLDDSSATVRLDPETATELTLVHSSGRVLTVRVHCLPSDFPRYTFTRTQPAAPGSYVFGNIPAAGEGRFLIVLDGYGVPAWYQRVPVTLAQVGLLGPGRLVTIPLNTIPFGQVGGATAEVLDLRSAVIEQVSTSGVPLDFHEAAPTPDGHLLLLSYPVVTDVPSVDPTDPQRPLADCVIQEVDLQGQLHWSWRFSEHLNVGQESTTFGNETVGGQLVSDPLHCNSVEPLPNGDVLLSARHTDALYRISRATGEVVWKLGGTPTTLAQRHLQLVHDTNGGFFRQHDARVLPDGRLRLFDNHQPLAGFTRALFLELDEVAGEAHVAAELPGPASAAMGSVRESHAEGTLVSWGWVFHHAFTDYDAAGKERARLEYVNGSMNYRTVYAPPELLDPAAIATELVR